MVYFDKTLQDLLSSVEDLKTEVKSLRLENNQLKKENSKFKGEISKLQVENKKLKDEITKLKESINKDSTNSSKPPSTDNSFREKETTKKNSKGLKKRGGQIGGTTNNLKKVDNPNYTKIIQHSNCTSCHHSLEGVDAHFVSIKQLFDIPKIKMEVTQFEFKTKICPCCQTKNVPEVPNGLGSYVQYGDNIKALVGYLNTHHMIPYERITEFVKDFTSHPMSSGTVYTILQNFSDKLTPFEVKLKEKLLQSDVIHVDETGTNVAGKLYWSHTITTSILTYYAIHQKRGTLAMDSMEILPLYKGIMVHDHFKPYNNYNCTHSFCNAHLLRELRGVMQNEKVRWATDMHSLLTNMNNYIHTVKDNGKLSPSKGKIEQFFTQFDAICQSASKFYPPPANPTNSKRKQKQSKGKNLLDRFIAYKEETLRFFTNLSVPFTNNLAEQALRMLKVKEKISGCFASFTGAKIFNRIRSFISTVKKNNLSVFEELCSVLQGRVYMVD